MGDFEAGASASVESTVKYHPYFIEILTCFCNPEQGQCQAGSLTGAVSSQIVTEECKGSLNAVGNRM